jgi:rare lipoprotein A
MSQLRIWTSLAASVAIATLGSATPVHGQQPDSAIPDSAAIASGRAASGPVDPAVAPDTTKAATPNPSITLSDRRIAPSVSPRSEFSQLSEGMALLTAQAIATAAPAPGHPPETLEAQDASPEAATTPGAPRSVQGLVELHAHQSTGNVILYVRDLPVMTFLGNPETAASGGTGALAGDALKPAAAAAAAATPSAAPLATANPVATGAAALDRATAVAQQIEALYQGGLDASQIEYEWNSEDSRFWVTVEGDRLVAIDGATVLPEQTQNAAEDAWQVTNRLRRLLGGAAPLEPINQPPRPQRAAIDFNPPSPGVQVDGYRVVSSNMGHASWYGPGFSGRPTASGERFNPNDLTAAHRTLPFGTRVRVTYPRTGRSVIVRINDRGPFIRGRTIDLSAGAARQIGLYSSGVGQVQMEILAPAPSLAAN